MKCQRANVTGSLIFNLLVLFYEKKDNVDYGYVTGRYVTRKWDIIEIKWPY